MTENTYNKLSGQSLLEVIIAIGIIVTVLFGVWVLFLSNYNTEREAETRIVAANLAREGIEAVKNLRDSNWIKINENATATGGLLWSWYQNTSNGLLDFNIGTVADLFGQDIYISSTPDEDSPLNKLYLNAAGYFDHNPAGTSTAYSRVLIFSPICCIDALAGGDGKCDDYIFTTSTSCVGNKIKIGMDVISKVKWTVAGKPRAVIVEDQIFNWR